MGCLLSGLERLKIDIRKCFVMIRYSFNNHLFNGYMFDRLVSKIGMVSIALECTDFKREKINPRVIIRFYDGFGEEYTIAV